ncbi:hypothetical protein E3N88_45074 [Mikania micrantha]|uniref:Uncharacterized protein n=1 Tax=Mikania micrantha TaxID=192012 RepID=A0A5N6LAT1_9ASTR|nr:hypothetical protein E3N88_45074 [Mikania micrantha]
MTSGPASPPCPLNVWRATWDVRDHQMHAAAKDFKFKESVPAPKFERINPGKFGRFGSSTTWNTNHSGMGRSFKDVVLNSSFQYGEKELILNSFRPQALAVWGNDVLIGRAIDLQSLCGLGDWAMQIHSLRGMRYLGGLYVMIHLSGTMHAEKIISESQSWDAWFSKLYRWDGKSIPYERIAWLKVFGVPPILWDPVVINQLGEKVGKLLSKSEASLSDQNLSQDCLAVLVSDGKLIYEKINIRWEGKTFVCWLVEDTRAWAPDYVTGGDVVPDSEAAVPGSGTSVPESGGADGSPMDDRPSRGEMERRMGNSNAVPINEKLHGKKIWG